MSALVKKLLKGIMPYGAVVLYRNQKRESKINYCPICEQEGVFLPMPSTGGIRPKAVCPHCGALERHRLTWLFLNRKIGLSAMKGKSMLHVAAEATLEPKLRKLVGKRYLTADYIEKADIKMDITNIKYKDESFDHIICNHVLEHVDSDTKAMSELRRVLKQSGWAILLIPRANMAATYEDNLITSKKGRLEAFGQEDHVRKYGRDYLTRLKAAGWEVKIYRAKDIATRQEIKRMALKEDPKLWGFVPTEVYFCTK